MRIGWRKMISSTRNLIYAGRFRGEEDSKGTDPKVEEQRRGAAEGGAWELQWIQPWQGSRGIPPEGNRGAFQ